MTTPKNHWETVLLAAIVVFAGVCAQAQAQEEERIVRIAPEVEEIEVKIDEDVQVVEALPFWIGIRGRSIENEVLRTHLQLAEDMGVIVEEVVPESPAAKAGLRKHDVILRANDDAVDNMRVLQNQVREFGDKPIELSIIRLGKEENVVVVPEKRPEQVLTEPTGPQGFKFGFGGDQELGPMLRMFDGRNIGPGMVFRGGQAFNFNEMPSGVSVSIQRNNDEPAQIIVKKGDQTWQVQGDDEESLKQLPDDVRPFVERMLQRPAMMNGFDLGNLDLQLQKVLPRAMDDFQLRNKALQERLQDQEKLLQKRMKQLEKQMQKMQERFDGWQGDVPEQEQSF